MDIKSKHTVQITFSLPESSASTTWTTPEAQYIGFRAKSDSEVV